MDKKRICCLKRISEKPHKTTEHLIIPLEDVTEVVIGRSLDVGICLLSEMISRKHAIFQKGDDGVWTVTDNKSLNGIFINDKRITALKQIALKDGDIVQLGVRKPDEESAEFVWKFCLSLRVKAVSGGGQHLPSDDLDSSPRKRKHCNPTSPEIHRTHPTKKTQLKRMTPGTQQHQSPPSEILQQKLAEQEKIAQDRIREQERKLAELQTRLAQKEKVEENLLQKLKERESDMKLKMEKQKVEMEEAQKNLEKQLRREFEEELKDKEDALVARLVEDQEKLKDERNELEEKLKEENKASERDQEAIAKLHKEKEKLDKVIQQKKLEQKLLESQLNDVKCENMKQKEDMLKVKEDILHNFAELMEMELQCSICNELFVYATSLQCSHSFCEMCIEQWMESKKICPNCRAPITSKVRSIVLDSYIDKMVENLSDEMKTTRKELVEERKADAEKRKAEKAAKEAEAGSSGRGRGGRRGRGRGRRSGGDWRATTAAARDTAADAATSSGVATRSAAAPVIVPVSDSSDSDGDEDSDEVSSEVESEGSDSDSSVEGHSYYGGYGRCFRCNRRGHWANGCPF